MSTAEDMVRHAYALRRDGNVTSSLQMYREAFRAFGTQDEGRAHCLRHIGDLALELGYREEARAALLEAEALYRSSVDDTLSLANTLRLLALLEGEKSIWSQAKALYERVANERGLDLDPALAECDFHLAQV